MNRLFILFIAILSAINLSSCSRDNAEITEVQINENRPIAGFTVEKGDDPFTFKFMNTSKNFKDVEWRFGDDSLSTEASPSHVYLRSARAQTADDILAGNVREFTVELTVTNNEGATAVKRVTLTSVVPDSLGTFKASQLNNGSLKFTAVLDPKINIKSTFWFFGDGVKYDTVRSPVYTYPAGFVGSAAVIITTMKNSQFILTKPISSAGTLSKNLFNKAADVFTVKQGWGGGGGEAFQYVYDGSNSTKFLNNFSSGFWMEWQPEQPLVANFYTFTSGNDASDRDPKKWNLQGSNDGVSYTTLDERSNQTFSKRTTVYAYSFTNTVAYKYYRVNFIENNGGGLWQMTEWAMYKAD